MKKIDIHCHVAAFPQYQNPDNPYNNLSAEEFIKEHDKLDVDLGVILPVVSPECTSGTGSNFLAKLVADRFPERFTWFCNLDPRGGRNSSTTDFSVALNHYKNLGAKGVGELTASLYADDLMMDNLFRHCAECDMPVLVHIAPQLGGAYGIVDDLGLPRIEKMLKKHPDLKLIGHSMCFWSEISAENTNETRNKYPVGKVKEGRLAELMREYGNLYCDLSAGSGSNAMMRDPEYAAEFMAEFSDRIYYGTDICYAGQTFQYKFDEFLTKMVHEEMLSKDNYKKIIRQNAAKLLGIED